MLRGLPVRCASATGPFSERSRRTPTGSGSHFDSSSKVTGQPGARISAFQQIVAEQCIAGEAAVEDAVNGVHLINSFSGEAAFAIQILISVRSGAGVNIEAGFSRINSGKARPGRALHADADPR